MAYEEMSKEEAGGIFFRAPVQPQMAEPEVAPAPLVAKPAPIKASKSTAAKIDTSALVSDVAAAANQMQKEAPKPEMPSVIDTLVNEITSNWKPLAIGAGMAVGAELLRRSIQNRKQGGAKVSSESSVRIEPTMAPEPIQTPATTVESPTLTPQQVVERNRAAGIGQGSVPGSAAPTAAPASVSAPVAPQPVTQAPVTATEAVATGQSPSKAIQMDVAQQLDSTPTGAVAPESGVKKRAAKTTQTFKSAEKLPEGMTFRGDLGPGDNWLYNTYGAEGRKAILSAFNEGKPAVSYERAKELSQMVQQGRVGPAIPRDIAKERGIAPPETNYGKLGTAIKVAGAAGLGLTAAQMANAAQQARQGNYAPAGEFGFNLLGLLPGLGTAFNIGTYSPELGAGEQKELAKRWRTGSSTPAKPTVD